MTILEYTRKKLQDHGMPEIEIDALLDPGTLAARVVSVMNEELEPDLEGPFEEMVRTMILRFLRRYKKGPAINRNDSDPVNRPSHYTQYPMECIDVLRVVLTSEEFRGFCVGNAVKYRWRRHDKGNELQDLAKAEWYLRCAAKAEISE